ncbi:MAG: hypothetical protein KJ607_05665 [Bacteroidetes bacterium]|nr:hypothetical protein [Bacteroidota bacterium]
MHNFDHTVIFSDIFFTDTGGRNEKAVTSGANISEPLLKHPAVVTADDCYNMVESKKIPVMMEELPGIYRNCCAITYESLQEEGDRKISLINNNRSETMLYCRQLHFRGNFEFSDFELIGQANWSSSDYNWGSLRPVSSPRADRYVDYVRA